MGFEPMTCALRVRCSTTELPGPDLGKQLYQPRRTPHCRRTGNEARSAPAALTRGERLLEVRYHVEGILEPEADPDQTVGDAARTQRLGVQLPVRRRCRVRHESVRAAK